MAHSAPGGSWVSRAAEACSQAQPTGSASIDHLLARTRGRHRGKPPDSLATLASSLIMGRSALGLASRMVNAVPLSELAITARGKLRSSCSSACGITCGDEHSSSSGGWGVSSYRCGVPLSGGTPSKRAAPPTSLIAPRRMAIVRSRHSTSGGSNTCWLQSMCNAVEA
eukprot:scaffold45811_cov69-Phaeocystis_antarctica.AAC.2